MQIGNVVCGPSGRVAAAAPAAVDAPQALPTARLRRAGDGSRRRTPPATTPATGSSLAAFAIMLAGGTAVVVVRWLRA